ncbi:hypothetical protein [Corallococcus exiguus]|uniref:hypothetical protein n=1 Tax=Corallococcus exiguus TaxID=83462 RepID=UPI0015603AA1|nr:hypothetical protein [Corallococcus exiguus]NRD55707.1 hypothetical protein [Corallococcus exiguus]
MIHVRVRPEQIESNWLTKAQSVTDKLKACTDDPDDIPEAQRRTAHQKRKEIIKNNQELWTELKSKLLSWSHNKCWYSELRDEGSDLHVDHFRPKGGVTNPGEPEREGYWWLAFDWTNYRIAVSWCNSPHKNEQGLSKGKHDQFPLKPGSHVALTPDAPTHEEEPYLLDPTDESDVAYITFDEQGLPVSTVPSGWQSERVDRTRDILHLDAPQMVEARKRVWRECEHIAAAADRLIQAPSNRYNSDYKREIEARFKELCGRTSPTAELSTVARAFLEKCQYGWARKLLYRAIEQSTSA